MKKYFPQLICFLFVNVIFAQNTIYQHSFEPEGDTWGPIVFSTPPCETGDNVWNYKMSLDIINPVDGDYFWGIEDLKGNCGSGLETIEFSKIDISLIHNTQLLIDFNVLNFAGGDKIFYQLILDDVIQEEIEFFNYLSSFSTNGWETLKVKIPNKTQNLRLIIKVIQNGVNQYAGLDNIRLTGQEINPCQELFISEYINGTSTNNHNNNFIEIYNPNAFPISLNEYQLTSYINTNLDSISPINLSGTIEPFDVFLIEDEKENLNIEADYSTNSSILNFTGNDKIVLLKNYQIIDILGVIGEPGDFAKEVTLRRKSFVNHPTAEYNLEEWDVYGLENISDLNVHKSYCEKAFPEIELAGDQIPIPDGNISFSSLDLTYFGLLKPNSARLENSFSIKNIGIADLEINDIQIIQEGNSFQIVGPKTFSIAPDKESELVIGFDPTTPGIHIAEIIIPNNDPSESEYSFKIAGELGRISDASLMITQYYQGTGSNKWIEITNIGDTLIEDGDYYLATFNNSNANEPLNKKPSSAVKIPRLNSGESILFRSNFTVSQPVYALNHEVIPTRVCNFNGDDIVVLSSTIDESCWENRIDLIGESGQWTNQASYVRNYGCDAVQTKTYYDENDWINFSVEQIDLANEGFNNRLGEHYVGPVIFSQGTWSNGNPEFSRPIKISDDYDTESNGEFSTCSLIIDAQKEFVIGFQTSIRIQSNLEVYGLLKIENEGSLIIADNNANITNQGKIEVHKTTNPVKKSDYTYWSSPVKSADISSVFVGSHPNSFFEFSAEDFEDQNKDNYDDTEPMAWKKVQGPMIPGKGYTAMASQKEPFNEIQKVIFEGTINNGNIEIPIKLSQNDSVKLNNWNLVGNPYPSAIDLELFLNHPENKETISGAVYFWTHQTEKNNGKYSADDYAIFIPGIGGVQAHINGKIPTNYWSSCQGIFVNALKEGTLKFDNNMKVHDPANNFFKGEHKKETDQTDKIWLNLYNDEGVFSQILVGFLEGATENFEPEYDAIRLSNAGTVSLFSYSNNNRLAIQGTDPLDNDSRVTIGLDSNIDSEMDLKIGIHKTEGKLNQSDVLLFDKETGTVHNLKQNDYIFKVKKSESFMDRFELVFDKNTISGSEEILFTDQIQIQTMHDHWQFNSVQNLNMSNLTVYDLLGRVLWKKEGNFKSIQLSKEIAKSNVILVQVQLEDFTILSKKMLVYK